ncbi:hypothetical protein D9758_012983 [Tetrapyrgos nigripes]|uniref:TIGR04076 family protein n=1 Tax=Tetrapyrgos nigripes TaxID=182062 RepID=A0A8H5CLP5_9AGAR|nr:hypothetical protein D9758_012983 [Tetrapyrgos nigripes]
MSSRGNPNQTQAATSSDTESPSSTTPDVDRKVLSILYDLRVEVICPPGEDPQKFLCGAKEGDYFTLEGEMLRLPEGNGFSIYSLAALLPLLPAKQRPGTHPNDWMTTDAIVACPDPNCRSQMRIIRTGLRTFRRGDVTVVPLSGN